jgi:hypothetical protein
MSLQPGEHALGGITVRKIRKIRELLLSGEQ